MGGGHDEREQTLNQLLVEMDGFESNDGVILIAATNRPDVLDPALLRPGRFDRQIVVDRPDIRGREGILKVHMKNKPIAEDVDLRSLARGTPGMAGADLANLVNEAALLAARRNQKKIQMTDFEEAKDKVMMGAERKSLCLSDEEKRTTAYHESGHALVGWMLPEADPIHKVTVIPRGRALGLTHFLPEGDAYTRTREYFIATMTAMMGGRAAEELIFGKITNGAASDIQSATHLARKMVCEWGMSDRLGPLQFGKKQDLIFLGREITEQKDYSERTAEIIDEEVHAIVQGAYDHARTILQANINKLHALAGALLEREILDREEIDEILTGDGTPRVPRATEPAPLPEPAKPVAVEARGPPRDGPRSGPGSHAEPRSRNALSSEPMQELPHWPAREISIFRAGSHTLELGRSTRVLGILNVTPDSFWDGGRFTSHESIDGRLVQIAEEGADMIDIGGESTRPGAAPVEIEDEWKRIHAALTAVRRNNVKLPVSIDTMKPEIARRALDEGAAVINDVSGLRGGPEIARLAARANAGLILMHMKGEPRTMQADPRYDDLLGEVRSVLAGAVRDGRRCRRPKGEHPGRSGNRIREDGRAQPLPSAKRVGLRRARGRDPDRGLTQEHDRQAPRRSAGGGTPRGFAGRGRRRGSGGRARGTRPRRARDRARGPHCRCPASAGLTGPCPRPRSAWPPRPGCVTMRSA